MDEFPVIDVTSWHVAGDEVMGTKPKVWLECPDDGVKWLWKLKSRENSEDDWSEKIAAEVAELLGVPHATVQLATRDGRRGVLSRDLVGEAGAADLLLGNNLLLNHDPDYPARERYRVAAHSVGRVHSVINRSAVIPPDPIPSCPPFADAWGAFIGYLLLDALIGNTDRHHENWAVLVYSDDRPARLCPSFDHASSLGHNVLDRERQERLTTRDRNRTVAAYATRALSGLYESEDDAKALPTERAFQLAGALDAEAADFWHGQLAGVEESAITDLVSRVPPGIMSVPAREFVRALMCVNRYRLLYP